MKNILFVLILLFVSYFASGQVKTCNEITELMKKQEQAWNAGNIEGFMSYYWKSDSLKFIGSKGITYGWQQTYDNYKKSYPDKATMGVLTFEIKTNEMLSKNSVFIIGKWMLSREKPVGGYFTLLWKKLDGKWVIVADHTS